MIFSILYLLIIEYLTMVGKFTIVMNFHSVRLFSREGHCSKKNIYRQSQEHQNTLPCCGHLK